MPKCICSINVTQVNFNQKVSANSKYVTGSLLLSRNKVDIELSQIKPHENGLDYCRLLGATMYSDR